MSDFDAEKPATDADGVPDQHAEGSHSEEFHVEEFHAEAQGAQEAPERSTMPMPVFILLLVLALLISAVAFLALREAFSADEVATPIVVEEPMEVFEAKGNAICIGTDDKPLSCDEPHVAEVYLVLETNSRYEFGEVLAPQVLSGEATVADFCGEWFSLNADNPEQYELTGLPEPLGNPEPEGGVFCEMRFPAERSGLAVTR